MRTRDSIRRFGLGKVLIRSLYRRFGRILSLNVSVIHARYPEEESQPRVAGYETREMLSDEFHAKLCPELSTRDMRWAFDRGDFCVASLFDETIVGFNFWSQQDTQVNPDIVFLVPEKHIYSFATSTAKAHRGKGLAPERWKVAAPIKAQKFGKDLPTIHYVEVVNYESRVSGQTHRGISPTVGYSGFFRLLGRWFVFRSPGCKRYGTGFTTRSRN